MDKLWYIIHKQSHPLEAVSYTHLNHTQVELAKLENVRRFLLTEDIIDDDSFIDYVTTI